MNLVESRIIMCTCVYKIGWERNTQQQNDKRGKLKLWIEIWKETKIEISVDLERIENKTDIQEG